MGNVKLTAALIFIIGLMMQLAVLHQLEVLIVTSIFFLVGVLVIYITGLNGRCELDVYFLSFAMNLFWAGVASIYRIYLKDPQQLTSDSNDFYKLSSNLSPELTLDQLHSITDGGLAVYIWRGIYRFFYNMNFKLDAYIGISLNICLVALTGVVAMKIVKAIYGQDRYRLNRMTYLYSFCGIFWLYAAVHLRDSMILFSITVLIYFWIKLLVQRKIVYAILVFAVSVIWILSYKHLRAEFQYIPITIAAAGVLAWGLSARNAASRALIVTALMTFSALLFVNYNYISEFQEEVKFGKTWGSKNSTTSLGERYVVNTPLPIRAIVGSYYLHVDPIPFWGGIQLSTAYHLFKSLNVLYLIVVIPMGIVGGIKAITLIGSRKSAPVMFAMIVYLGFSIVVATTSLETRHLGVFFVAFLILAISPDFKNRSDKISLNNWRLAWISVIALVHVTWVVLKL